MLAGRHTVKNTLFPNLTATLSNLQGAFDVIPSHLFLQALSIPFLFPCCSFWYVFIFLQPFFEHQNHQTPSCHLVTKGFFFLRLFFSKPLLPSTFPLGCMSQTHAVLNEKQPLTWGPWRLQHLNLLLFLPPFLLGTSDIVRC